MSHGLLVAERSAAPLPAAFSRVTVVPEIAGASATTHEVQVALEPAAQVSRYIVVSRDYEAPIQSAIARALSAEVPGALAVFLAASEAGRASACFADGTADQEEVAVAVAEVQRAAAWDESPRMEITINGVGRSVAVSWADGGTRATVAPGVG